MKYLTPLYLALMYAFKDHADKRLEEINNFNMPAISILQEYCTFRVDAGRQTGKTRATLQFANDWINDGGSVIFLSNKMASSINLERSLLDVYNSDCDIKRIELKQYKNNIISTSIRDFLSDNCNKFRGHKINRVLFIIDEPIKVPEMTKFYDKYIEQIIWSVAERNFSNKWPLFFVIGMQ